MIGDGYPWPLGVYPYQPPGVCPGCGHCQTCGRPMPVNPYQVGPYVPCVPPTITPQPITVEPMRIHPDIWWTTDAPIATFEAIGHNTTGCAS
jgi:hypothetical protein